MAHIDPAWFAMVSASALGWCSSVETTYDVCRTALERGIPGDFVECGVYAGAQAAVMARAILDLPDFSFRRVHLFDSFNGIPAAGPEDHEMIETNAQPGGSACSLEEMMMNMERWGIPHSMLRLWPGLFSETMKEVTASHCRLAKNGIAVLRLDGDLYSSTETCLEYLYPLVSKGGYVIVDDFNLSGCRKSVVERLNPAPIYFRKPNHEPSGTR